MHKYIFWILFCFILMASALIRFIPSQNNNFYFTTDQAYDAVHVREILESHKILLKGPETGLRGVFHGPLWYYFIAIGYFFFKGHPFGGLFIIIVLNLATTAFVMWYLKDKLSSWSALGIGIALQIFWPYYDFSRYAFNPFPSAYFAIFLVLFLTEFLNGKRSRYYWALLLIFLSANGEIVAAAAFLLFYFVVGMYGVYKKLLLFKHFVVVNLVLPFIGLLPIIFSLYKQLKQSSLSTLGVESTRGYFSGFNYTGLLIHFSDIFQRSVLPQSLILAILAFGIISFFAWKRKSNLFTKRFSSLTLSLWLISYLFFGSNKGWMEWHTYYLYLVTFISFFLLIFSLPKKISLFCFGLFITFQFIVFKERYLEYFIPTTDPGLLVNQIKVVDWVYQNAEHDGFSAFTYSPTGFDYPYQYLFWWYGKKTYDYIPCEYSNAAPGVWKLYMPDPIGFSSQTLDCNRLRFLLYEPGQLPQKQATWSIQAQDKTILLEDTIIGQVKIEKRRLMRKEEL